MRNDIVAGFVVFLIALPLSIGIAVAAGAPASAGILSAILGGLLGTLVTGANISITGPAAGLIVVISNSIIVLGEGDMLMGFKRTLAATIIAGVLQILLGLFRLGKLTLLAPLSVVSGMLSAIGVIIIIKQIPALLGVPVDDQSVMNLIINLPLMLGFIQDKVAIISICGMTVLWLWRYLPAKFSSLLPAPLIVVAVGLFFSHYHTLESQFLVYVPSSLKELIIFPEFDRLFTMKSLMQVLSIFIVASLESLLSAYAVDKMDPQQRRTHLDKELIGKGITNIFCGLLGAYPVITEIVRSRANILNGAQSKWSNFYHGLFILVFVTFASVILNKIPTAALAAILLFVGFSLAHPREFKKVWSTGKDQFLYFFTTLMITVFVDLLMGIFCGIALKLIHHYLQGVRLKDCQNPQITFKQNDNETIITLHSHAVFLAYFKINKQLSQLSQTQKMIINSNGFYIDYTISELIKEKVLCKK